MLRIILEVDRDGHAPFGMSEKEALAYALTTWFNSKGLFVLSSKVREIRNNSIS